MTAPKGPDEPRYQVGRPTKYKRRYCGAVIEEMSKGFSLSAFAGIIGVSRATLNVWMAEHPEFLDAVSRGKSGRLVHWEKAALRVAEDGGGPGTSTIIVFGLKNMGGDEWADKTQTEHTGKDGGPIQTVDLSKMSDDDLNQLEAIIGSTAHSSGNSGRKDPAQD